MLTKNEMINDVIENLINESLYGLVGNVNFNRDRVQVFRFFLKNFFRKTLRMFEYENLPETVDALTLERILQGTGSAVFCYVSQEDILNENFDIPEGYYVFPASKGGVLDNNYMPTIVTYASAFLSTSISKVVYGDKEAVLLRNDPLLMGLASLNSLTASELTDNVTTLHFEEVQARIISILKAESEDDRKDALEVLKSYENGDFGIVLDKDMIDGINTSRVEPFKTSAAGTMKDNLEVRQFLLAHWYIELGLNDNYNMKREAINENEIDANSDTLFALIDEMYASRLDNVERINKRYGLNVKVKFSEQWESVRKRKKNADEKAEAELQAMEAEAVAVEEKVDAEAVAEEKVDAEAVAEEKKGETENA